MDYSDHDPNPAELEQVAALLRAERPAATELELDRIKLRAMDRAGRSRLSLYARQKGKLMKSRLALTMVIATGMLMGTAGVTMAVSGNSGSDSAAKQQYAPPGEDKNDSAVLGLSDEDVAPPSDQVATANTDSGSLPFTGFAAIPLLVLGVGFLTVGVVLRLRLSHDET